MPECDLDPNPSRERRAVEKSSGIILKLVKTLADMEKDGDFERRGSGEVEGPFCSNALYSYNIKLGIEDEDLTLKRRFRPRSRYRRIGVWSKW